MIPNSWILAFWISIALWGCGNGNNSSPDAAEEAAILDEVGADASWDANPDIQTEKEGPTENQTPSDGACGQLPDGGDFDPKAALCQSAHGPVPPVDTGDISFDQWTVLPCFLDACFCDNAAHSFLEKLLSCDAVQGGYWWGMGSMAIRVAGRKDCSCLLDVGSEVEGGVSMSRCTVPLPITPWAGIERSGQGGSVLEGIENQCTLVGFCSLQEGGPDPCNQSDLNPPLCPPADAMNCDP